MTEEAPQEKLLVPPGGDDPQPYKEGPPARRRASAARSDVSGHVPLLSQPHTRRMSRVADPAALQVLNHRRVSTWRRGSYAPSLRTDRTDPSHMDGPLVRLQNTYRTDPDPKEKFAPRQVKKVVENILSSYLEGEAYDPRKCAHLAQSLTDVIKKRVKEMNLPRYKIVCNVVIGQKQHQAIRCASRCLWNDNLDNSASASFENSTLFAMATVYGLYYE